MGTRTDRKRHQGDLLVSRSKASLTRKSNRSAPPQSLHVNVQTFVPAFAARKYLARRPTCIAKIAEYLQSHGAPSKTLDPVLVASGTNGTIPARRRRDSISSKRSARSARSAATTSSPVVFAGLPSHVSQNTEAPGYGEIQRAQKLFKAILGSSGSDWTVAVDHKGSKIWMRKRDGNVLPIVKGEATVEGVTTEQVLGTILSEAARRDCESCASRLFVHW
jgi:hypothetical protein